MLTEIEDSLLAMSEGEPAQQKIAIQVLASWYGRRIGLQEVTHIACRLANLGLVRWIYWRNGKQYLSKKVRPHIRRSLNSSVLATAKGQTKLHESKEQVI